jgi:thiol-disulfide isomerase/thioredoxin
MDGVYVFLVNRYYKTEKADWVDSTQLAGIVENADKIEPLLIGKIAPDIIVYKENGDPISLHEVQSKYTLLLFWAQDCGHCKKSFPGLIEFYNNYKDKGLEIFAVCSKLMDEELGCWDYLKDKEGADWINTSDKFMRSGFKVKYNIRSTPQLYLLDKDKKIITKKMAAEKLPEIMDMFLEHDNPSTESK